MYSLVHALKQFGGVARRVDLVEAGISPSEFRRATEAGEVSRISRGVYALPDADPLLSTIHAAKARPACITAAAFHGLWVLYPSSRPHVAVNHGRQVPGFEVHRHAGQLSLLDIVAQCMRCLPEIEALVIAESAVVLKRITVGSLRQRLSGRKDAGLRHICGQINPHSESIIETVGRYRLQQAGLQVQTQVRIRNVGRLDLFVDGILGIEIDGAAFHSSRDAYREDRRRWNLLTRGAVPVLRVTYEMVVHEPQYFVSLVQETLINAVDAHR